MMMMMMMMTGQWPESFRKKSSTTIVKRIYGTIVNTSTIVTVDVVL